MTAERLRTVAALMRERAEAATSGIWTADPTDGDVWGEGNRERICRTSSFAYHSDSDHIASWHPAVALAVADWLDDQAEVSRRVFLDVQRPSAGVDQPPAIHYGDVKSAAAAADHHTRHALTVANAYLGGTA